MSDRGAEVPQDFYLLTAALSDSSQAGQLAIIYTPLASMAGVLVTATLVSGFGGAPRNTLVDLLPALVEGMESIAPTDVPACWVLRDADGRFDFVVRTGNDTYGIAPVVPMWPGCETRSLAALRQFFPTEASQVESYLATLHLPQQP
ncbi:MAG: hypothetical protein Q7T63_03960 [Burkholderiaceae bacterium]|nr:hypothetical protein [Burkholderiaceae bacterium]MDP3135611.1 hypothetical protein [Burkholderiaceae bacterium]